MYVVIIKGITLVVKNIGILANVSDNPLYKESSSEYRHKPLFSCYCREMFSFYYDDKKEAKADYDKVSDAIQSLVD